MAIRRAVDQGVLNASHETHLDQAQTYAAQQLETGPLIVGELHDQPDGQLLVAGLIASGKVKQLFLEFPDPATHALGRFDYALPDGMTVSDYLRQSRGKEIDENSPFWTALRNYANRTFDGDKAHPEMGFYPLIKQAIAGDAEVFFFDTPARTLDDLQNFVEREAAAGEYFRKVSDPRQPGALMLIGAGHLYAKRESTIQKALGIPDTRTVDVARYGGTQPGYRAGEPFLKTYADPATPIRQDIPDSPHIWREVAPDTPPPLAPKTGWQNGDASNDPSGGDEPPPLSPKKGRGAGSVSHRGAVDATPPDAGEVTMRDSSAARSRLPRPVGMIEQPLQDGQAPGNAEAPALAFAARTGRASRNSRSRKRSDDSGLGDSDNAAEFPEDVQMRKTSRSPDGTAGRVAGDNWSRLEKPPASQGETEVDAPTVPRVPDAAGGEAPVRLLYSDAFQRVANKYKVVLGVRAPNALGETLLREGFPSKNFHVKAKSSPTGPTAGFIAADPRYSKLPASKLEVQAKYVAEALKNGARLVDLELSPQRLDELVRTGHLESIGDGQYAANYPLGRFEFSIGPDGRVTDATGQAVQVLTNPPEKGRESFNAKPITADYDLFGIFPRANQADNARSIQVAPRLVHGEWIEKRLSLFKNKGEEDPNMGNVHVFGKAIIRGLNKEVGQEGYKGGKLVWHGDEIGNPFSAGFDEADMPIFIIPGQESPVQIKSQKDLLDFYDRLRVLGYVPESSARFGF